MRSRTSRHGVGRRLTVLIAGAFIVSGAALIEATRRSDTNMLDRGSLVAIRGRNTNWQSQATRTCIQQTWADWLAYDPDIGKTVSINCTTEDAKSEPPKKCWTCEDPKSATHHVISGGGGGSGEKYAPEDCGKMKEGICKLVDGAPTCFNPQIKPNYFCSAAQVQSTQTINP